MIPQLNGEYKCTLKYYMDTKDHIAIMHTMHAYRMWENFGGVKYW